jgi:hypothetical protein
MTCLHRARRTSSASEQRELHYQIVVLVRSHGPHGCLGGSGAGRAASCEQAVDNGRAEDSDPQHGAVAGDERIHDYDGGGGEQRAWPDRPSSGRVRVTQDARAA